MTKQAEAILKMPKPSVVPRKQPSPRIDINEMLGKKPFKQLAHEQEFEEGEFFLNQKVNYYTFATDMQERMIDLVKPCLENQLADRQVMKELQLYHNKLSKRLQYMEACFN